jgi:hypothetical protein
MKTNYMNLVILTLFFLHFGGLKKPPILLIFQISKFLFLFGEIFAGKKKRGWK